MSSSAKVQSRGPASTLKRTLCALFLLTLLTSGVPFPAAATFTAVYPTRSWGRDVSGQLGDDSAFANKGVPVSVAGLEGIVQIAAGASHTLALRSDGKVFSWGDNVFGQLGNGEAGAGKKSALPIEIAIPATVVAIAAGGSHSIALTEGNFVYQWGSLTAGSQWHDRENLTQCPGKHVISSPQQVNGLTMVRRIAAGTNHFLAAHADGTRTVSSMGVNDSGQLGDGTIVPHVCLPVSVFGVDNVEDVAAGDVHSLAFESNGEKTIFAWGGNSDGQIGDGTTIDRPTPVPVQVREGGLLTPFTSAHGIAAGARHSLALKTGGALWTWGSNSSGQLGHGDLTSRPLPANVGLSNGLTALVASGGGSHSAVITSNYAVYTWGSNADGQLGRSFSGVANRSPGLVSTLGGSGATGLAAGGSHTLAITAPKATIAPATLNFAERLIGSTSAAQKLTVTNGGPGKLLIGDVGIDVPDGAPAHYLVTSDLCTGRELIPNASCDVMVKFAPQLAGQHDVNLKIETNALNAPHFVAMLGRGTAPAGEAPSGRIAFASTRDGNSEIYVIRVNGSAPTRLTSNIASDTSPAWAPNATHIAFVSTRDGNSEIYVSDSGGGTLARLTNDAASDTSPAWSPNGQKIAFVKGTGATSEIWVMNPDGTSPLKLTSNTVLDGSPSWSPDSANLLFATERDGNREIYVMGADGSAPARLTESSGTDTSPAYAPNGSLIAFASNRDGDFDIYLMSSDGTLPLSCPQPQRIDGACQLTTNSSSDTSPAWSKDSMGIVFGTDRDGNSEIYSMDTGGNAILNLTNNNKGDHEPAWVETLKVSAAVSTVGASPPQVPVDHIPVQPNSNEIQAAPIKLIDGAPIKLIDGAPIKLIDGAPIKLIDGAPIKLIDGAPIKLIDGAPIKLIDGAPIKLIDGAKLVPLATLTPSGTTWEQLFEGTKHASKSVLDLTAYDYFFCIGDPADCQATPEAIQRLKDVSLWGLNFSANAIGNLHMLSILAGGTRIDAFGSTDVCGGLVDQNFACSEWRARNLPELELAGFSIEKFNQFQLQSNRPALHQVALKDFTLAAGAPLNEIRLAVQTADGSIGPGLIDFDKSNFGTIGISEISEAKRCTVVVDCTRVDAATATLAEAQNSRAIKAGSKFGDLGSSVGRFFMADVLLALVDPSTISELPFEKLVAGYGGAGSTSLAQRVLYSPVGTAATSPVVVKLTLPAGWTYKENSVAISKQSIGGNAVVPSVEPTELRLSDGKVLVTFELQGITVVPGESLQLDYAVRPWLQTGIFTTSAQIITPQFNELANKQAPVQVAPSHEPDGTRSEACASGKLIQQGAMAFGQIQNLADRDLWCFDAPAAGSVINVFLRNSGGNNQLILYHPVGSTRPKPLRELASYDPAILPAPDEFASLGQSGEPLAPESHQENVLETLPVAGMSENPGSMAESVRAISWPAPAGGKYVIQVSGAIGDFGPMPYALALSVTAPQPPRPCPAGGRYGANNGVWTNAGVMPPSVPFDRQTAIVYNQNNLFRRFGPIDGPKIINDLNSFITDPAFADLKPVLLPIDGNLDVRAAYDAWDANPCNVELARGVTRAINKAIDSVLTPAHVIKNLMIVGSDEDLPYGRAEDRTQLNEQFYLSEVQFSGENNALIAAFAEGNILTDSGYRGHPVPWGGDWIYMPTSSNGRIVLETPSDLGDAIADLKTSSGVAVWDPSSAVTSGYDFFNDAAEEVDRISEARFGSSQTDLTEPENASWSDEQLLSTLASRSAPTLLSANAHYDHFRLQPAGAQTEDDLITAQRFADQLSLDLWGLGTIGCHSALSIANSLLPNAPSGSDQLSRRTDWAEAVRRDGAAWLLGQTGFGLGDDSGVALSEEVLVRFLSNLDGGITVGDAYTKAITDFYLQSGAYGEYTRKAILTTNLHGFSFWKRAGSSTVPPLPAPPSLGIDPATGLTVGTISNNFGASDFSSKEAADGTGTYYEFRGEPAHWLNNRPTQPKTWFNVKQSTPGLKAHGVVFLPKTSVTETNFNPVQSKPVFGTEVPEPQFASIYPAAQAHVTRAVSADGESERAVVLLGRFSATGNNNQGETVGDETRFLGFDLMTYYSASPDFDAPSANYAAAVESDNAPTRFVVVTPSTDVARVVASYRLDGQGTWNNVNLNVSGLTWIGEAGANQQIAEWFATLIDSAGNASVVSGGGGGLPVLPDNPVHSIPVEVTGPLGLNNWFVGAVKVTIIGTPGLFEMSVDGSEFTRTNQIAIDRDGIFRVDYRASDGTAAGFEIVQVDKTDPTVAVSSPQETVYDLNQPVNAQYSCGDSLSQLSECQGVGNDGPVDVGQQVPTNELGTQFFTVTARDKAGNATTLTVEYTVVDREAPGITIVNPFDGEVFLLNQLNDTDADFFCVDNNSAIQPTCTGSVTRPDGTSLPVIDGGKFPVNVAGIYQLTVSSTDASGNSARRTHIYQVQYRFEFLEPPALTSQHQGGRTMPVSWAIYDSNGVFVSDPTSVLYLASYQVNPITGSRASIDEEYSVAGVRLSTNSYKFNWDTKRAWAGTSRVFLVRTKDLEDHEILVIFH